MPFVFFFFSEKSWKSWKNSFFRASTQILKSECMYYIKVSYCRIGYLDWELGQPYSNPEIQMIQFLYFQLFVTNSNKS